MFPLTTSVALTSSDDRPVAEVVGRNQIKHCLENGFGGLPIEMDPHRRRFLDSEPTSVSPVYLIGQQPRCFAHHRLISGDARNVVRLSLIRGVIRSVPPVTRTGLGCQRRFSRADVWSVWFYDATAPGDMNAKV